MKTKAEIEAERKSEEQFRLKMELHKAELQAMTLDDLRKKFKELDADGSNSISRIECQQMLRWIDPDMSEVISPLICFYVRSTSVLAMIWCGR